MDFFKYKDHKLILNIPEILLVKEFKAVLDEDTSKDKKFAFKVFQYIWLLLDWKSPYNRMDSSFMELALEQEEEFFHAYVKEKEQEREMYLYEEDRHVESIRDAELNTEDIDTPIVRAALRRYKMVQESDLTIVVINAMKASIHKYKKYYREIDFGEKVESGPRKGSLVFSINDYMRTMKDADKIFETIDKLEAKQKEKQEEEETKLRGNARKSAIQY